MDQWGVGRKGFDDGLVILFDLDPSREHGQVILYGGPGYRAAYLDNAEKQKIFDEDMLPLLQQGDLDGALLAALAKVDANATPEHAQSLQLARQVDAAVGLIVAPLVVPRPRRQRRVRLAALRPRPGLPRRPVDPHGRPAARPHAGRAARSSSPAASSRRSLTTALLDLASRGEIAFRQESELLGLEEEGRRRGRARRGRRERGGAPRPQRRPAARPGRGPRPSASCATLARRRRLHRARRSRSRGSAPSVPKFDKALEDEVDPQRLVPREAVEGHVALGDPGRRSPSSSASLGIVAGPEPPELGAHAHRRRRRSPAGSSLIVLARWMPAVSIPGAMIRAMLAAYRRTLEKTMDAGAVDGPGRRGGGLPWLETPDQAVVWGTALGLDEGDRGRPRAEHSTTSRRPRRARLVDVLPGLVSRRSGGAGSPAGSPARSARAAAGCFSSSGVPDIGGMMAALGDDRQLAAVVGGSGGGGGGFGGGGSGGGGGGSGGGF